MYTVGVAELPFEWDPQKGHSNRRSMAFPSKRPRLSFRTTMRCCWDDPERSDREPRFVLLGLSATLRILVVCHCYRLAGDVIRITSARKADRGEQAAYAER